MYTIVAVDENWAIGKDGDQLCYIPADLKRFQKLTTGHPVLLGRKTLSTFPGGRPLTNRRNLILSAQCSPGQQLYLHHPGAGTGSCPGGYLCHRRGAGVPPDH